MITQQWSSDSSHSVTEKETSYELEKKALVTGWEKIRPELLNVVWETSAKSIYQTCICCTSVASLKCKQRGPLGFYCNGCFENSMKW